MEFLLKIEPLRGNWLTCYRQTFGWWRPESSIEEVAVLLQRWAEKEELPRLMARLRRFDTTRECELLILDASYPRQLLPILVLRALVHGTIWPHLIEQWDRERKLGRRA